MLRLSCLLTVIKTFSLLRLDQPHHSHTSLAMFSLIRKISSQQQKDNMEQQTTTDDNETKHEEQQQQQQEEVDGTSYDPHADPRDPGSYYTFPHFADE
jgi:hypothetical protein